MSKVRSAKKYFAAPRLLVVLLFSPLLGWGLLFFAGSVPYGESGKVVVVEVAKGEPFSHVASNLSEQGVIYSPTLFTVWARMWGLDRKLGWGHYRFDLPLSAREVLNRLVYGKGAFRRVTIPEGLTVKQVGELLADNGLVNKNRFLAQAGNLHALSVLGLGSTGLEGYLFPDTYHFSHGASEFEILKTMVSRFRLVFTDAMATRARELGMSPHEVVTLASLIEKEASIENERFLVSAVFHNRLKLEMPLQSDPTVIYGLGEFSGNLTRKDLRTKTPYNTYLIRGLPPTPICSPGESSIQAALYPAAVPARYFVSRNDGSHVFSVTLREHNRAVMMYQKSSVRRPSSPTPELQAKTPATRVSLNEQR